MSGPTVGTIFSPVDVKVGERTDQGPVSETCEIKIQTGFDSFLK